MYLFETTWTGRDGFCSFCLACQLPELVDGSPAVATAAATAASVVAKCQTILVSGFTICSWGASRCSSWEAGNDNPNGEPPTSKQNGKHSTESEEVPWIHWDGIHCQEKARRCILVSPAVFNEFFFWERYKCSPYSLVVNFGSGSYYTILRLWNGKTGKRERNWLNLLGTTANARNAFIRTQDSGLWILSRYDTFFPFFRFAPSWSLTNDHQIPQDVSANKVKYENRAVVVDCKSNNDIGNCCY